MNFIMRFIDKTTNYANKYAVQREYDKLKDKLENSVEELHKRIDLYFDEIKQLNQRLNLLEKNSQRVEGAIPYVLNGKEIEYSTTSAIIDLLTKNKGKKLHYSNIYDMIKDYNLINKNVSLPSVKATLYGLARQNKISLCDGNKGGLFFIEQKKSS